MSGSSRKRKRTSVPQPVVAKSDAVSIPAATPIWWLLPTLVAAALAAYHPAWHGGLLWDDEGHVMRLDLQSWAGLSRIWFEMGATQQYYPLAHSAFWLLRHLAGGDTLVFHFANVLLHATSAFLLALILRRLGIPGATLAAIVFALHPVQVESVAWMTELKNTLSGVCYFAAALSYLKFDEERRPAVYASAFVMFMLALAAKTVTATLPAGLLVVLWWRRGRLRWKEDVVPLLPFFAFAALAGAVTSWVERTYIGAQGDEFALSFAARVIVAGRAVLFYLGKLIWPFPLIFNYAHWTIDAGDWPQYLFPLAVIALLACLWVLRGRSRAPLAALLFFGVTLAPALGFVNVFPFRFSFVADHFQYLACAGPIALAAAGAALASGRFRLTPLVAGAGLAIIAAGLGVLTWRQSAQYVDGETLYHATIARNPASWMSYNNLAALEMKDPRRLDEAATLIETSLRLNPRNADAYNNRGAVHDQRGQLAEARADFETAVRLNPRDAMAHANLGTVLRHLGRPADALPDLELALALEPRNAVVRESYGADLLALGRNDEAIAQLNEAIRLKPDYAEARSNLAVALARARRPADAVVAFQAALALQPDASPVHYAYANLLQDLNRLPEAVAEYRAAIRTAPDGGAAVLHNDTGVALAGSGRLAEAAAEFREAVRRDPAFEPARANLARAEQALRNGGG